MTRVAIVHDYFTQRGGAERVAERLAGLFPDAGLFTSAATQDATPRAFAGRELHTSLIQPLLAAGVPLKALAPLVAPAMRRLPLARTSPEVVLSSTSAFGHRVRVPAGAVHVVYCHAPPRFLWERDVYFSRRRALGRLLGPALEAMRRGDARAARDVDVYLANSAFTAARIERFYGRQATVVHPPIDTEAFHRTDERSGRFLVVARLVPHKRLDLAIAAANAAGLGLDIIGDGPDGARLRRLAGPTVRFLGRHDEDRSVREAMARCVALVVPGIEDFGMTTAEVQAAGRPPIAYAAGGSLEIVVDGVTGFHVAEQTPDAFAAAMRRALATELDPGALVASARRFDAARFDAAIRRIVDEALGHAVDAPATRAAA